MHERLDQIERYLLCFAVFFAPLRELRPTEINVTYSDLIFCLVAGMMLVRRRMHTAPMQDVTVVWMVAALCLIGGLFASSIVGGSASASLVVCTQYMFAYVFLPFVILRDGVVALTLVKTLMFASLFVVVCGFIFAATGHHGGHVYVSGSGRLASFAANPNDFAMMIALTTPLLLYLWFTGALSGLICLIAAICFFVGLVMASSNSGIGATTVGIIAFLLFTGRLQSLVKGGLIASLMVLAAATVGYDYLPDVFQKRVLSAFESGDLDGAGTYSDRMELIHEAMDKLDDSILLGIGANQSGAQSYSGDPVHNMYLLVWVEGGTIALFGWLLILVTMAFIGIRSYQQHEGAQEAAMVLSVTIIIVIVGITSPHLYSRSWVVPLLVAIGMPLSRRMTAMFDARAERERPQQPESSGRASEIMSLPHRPAMHAQIHDHRRR